MSGFHLTCTLCAEPQGPSFPGCSPPAAASHRSTSLPILSEELCARCKTRWERLGMPILAVLRSCRRQPEGRRGSSSQRYLRSGEVWEPGSAFPTPLGLLAPWRCSQRSQGPNQAPRGRSVTSHGLACRETTAPTEAGATGCSCKARMGQSTLIN